MKNILILSHISESYAPTFPFLSFLKQRDNIKLHYILHPLVNTGIKKSVFNKFYNKKECIVIEKRYTKKISIYSYVQNFLQNIIWVLQKGEKYDVCFGLNNLNALSGLILRLLGRTDKVVFYTVDYSIRRFNNYIINFLYNLNDKICVKFCDYTLSVSPRIIDVRTRMGLSKRRNLLQPNGVHLKTIVKKTVCNISNPIKLIYAGHITKSKGIHLIIKALYELRKTVNFQLDIYGDGPFLKNLEGLIAKHRLHTQIKLMGNIEHNKILLRYTDYDIGIALYTQDDSFNYYCDPVKVKEYLAAGLITIISDVPYIAEVIEERELGYKTSNSIEDIKRVLELALDKKNISKTKKNIRNCNLELDWDSLFKRNYNYIMSNL
jgi:glycosyltransferase involved in cell wall biosynthesis